MRTSVHLTQACLIWHEVSEYGSNQSIFFVSPVSSLTKSDLHEIQYHIEINLLYVFFPLSIYYNCVTIQKMRTLVKVPVNQPCCSWLSVLHWGSSLRFPLLQSLCSWSSYGLASVSAKTAVMYHLHWHNGSQKSVALMDDSHSHSQILAVREKLVIIMKFLNSLQKIM